MGGPATEALGQGPEATAPAGGPSGPAPGGAAADRRAARYERQAARYGRRAQALRRRMTLLSGIRLGAFATAAVFGWAAFYDRLPFVYGPVALLGLLAFGAAVWLHRGPHERLPRVQALERLHAEAAARLTGRWDALPDDGARYLDPATPHLGELQVFGRGSLYQLLCRAALPGARDRLAARLREPLPIAEVAAAQAGARELARVPGFGRRLHAEGRLVELSPQQLDRFVAWAEGGVGAADARFARLCALVPWVSVPLTWACIVAQASFGLPAPWRLALGFQLLFFAATTGRLSRIYTGLLDRDEVRPYVALRRMLARVERRRFRSAPLVALRDALLSAGERPSARLVGLETMTDSLAVRFNPISLFVANVLFLWEAFWVGRLTAWRHRHGRHVRRDLEILAEIEVLASVGGFAADHPGYAFPVLDPAASPPLSGQGLGHPLIPAGRRRTNDFAQDARLVLVTGSNMAGKSSFLRTVGVNVILGQAGAPACAAALTFQPCRLSTSIQITDDPEQGLSRFYAEVKRIRRILDECGAAEGDLGAPPRLYLVDEMLSGTNSRERHLASESVARQLLAHRRSFGLVTTHDLALVALEDRFPGEVRTCHFTDRFDGQALHFDYRLRPGVATTTNALDVLRLEGIEVVDEAGVGVVTDVTESKGGGVTFS